ncbi:MAG: protease-like activity factor CPAF [Bdellovibrionales bacterium]|nr:protease-like activity factor CPAF [Bdellovibrionales bacterium]
MKSFVIILATAFLSTHVFAQTLDANQKVRLKQEIDYIGSLYGSVYAPKAWKESHLGWNLPAEIATAQTKLAMAQNMHEARAAVAGLIKSTKDYHVSFSFYSTEKATLPFQVKTVEGKTLIVYIDRDKLSETAFPFEVGDEVLTLEQTPVAQVLKELIQDGGPNIPETDLAVADLMLTRRGARSNLIVPHGPVTLSIKRAADDTVGSISLAWEYTPEQLVPAQFQPFALKQQQQPLVTSPMFGPVYSELASETAANPYGLGGKKSFLPDFGTRIWQTADDNEFDAYIYLNNDGKLIGVVRIPGYIVADYDKAVKDFAGIIAHLEKNTSALVIDQNNNPGGSVFYLYALSSMLSDQPLTVPRHRIALSPGGAKECLDMIEQMKSIKTDADAVEKMKDLSGLPATYQLAIGMQNHCREFLSEFHQGVNLSSPLYLWGVDKVNPNPTHYTKPIVFLVNQLDFSGGDFMPATLQDNKRVTVVGTRTAGAGGFVLQSNFPNSFGLEMVTFTGSIAERVDKNPIENLGVTPDVSLPITVDDIRSGYKSYISQVQAVLKSVIK